MDKTAKVKMKKQLNVTDLSGEKVMVDFDNGKYYMIKGVGNDIWDMLGDQEIAVSEIIERLLGEYDVTEQVCESEVFDFLSRMQSLDIIDVK